MVHTTIWYYTHLSTHAHTPTQHTGTVQHTGSTHTPQRLPAVWLVPTRGERVSHGMWVGVYPPIGEGVYTHSHTATHTTRCTHTDRHDDALHIACCAHHLVVVCHTPLSTGASTPWERSKYSPCFSLSGTVKVPISPYAHIPPLWVGVHLPLDG